MGVVPKNDGIPPVLIKHSILIDKINTEKWRLGGLPQICVRTLEKANVLVQYPNYRNTLPFGTQITEYGFTEITEIACSTLMPCCCMMSVLLITPLMNGVLLMLSDTNPHQDSSFQGFCIHCKTQPMWISFCPHHHPEKYFVQLCVQQEVTSDQEKLWELGQWEIMD